MYFFFIYRISLLKKLTVLKIAFLPFFFFVFFFDLVFFFWDGIFFLFDPLFIFLPDKLAWRWRDGEITGDHFSAKDTLLIEIDVNRA